jgi:hypothetical protein
MKVDCARASSRRHVRRASSNLFFKIMPFWMVSGFKLARQRDIASRPPEKTRSTATVDPAPIRLASSLLMNESLYLEMQECLVQA